MSTVSKVTCYIIIHFKSKFDSSHMAAEEFEISESIKDDLAEFFTSPTKDKLPPLLQADTEYDFLDFKREWHERSKLAKHIIAFGNSGGGAIIYGVEEAEGGNLQSVGIDDPVDEADFGNKVEKYLPEGTDDLYALGHYSYNEHYSDGIEGKTYQVVSVEGAVEKAPLVATREGQSIGEGTIYVRRNTKSTKADYSEIQRLLRERREEGVEKRTAELHEELQELQTLYNQISKTKTSMMLGMAVSNVMTDVLQSKRNPKFPSRDFEEYISDLIRKKQKRIEKRLGVADIQLDTVQSSVSRDEIE